MSEGATAYIWEEPGGTIRIHLDLDVVERLSAAIQEALGTGARGMEIGGILLGESVPGNSRTLRIADFELVPFQHWRGSSYTASPKDREILGSRLSRHRPERVVGYFRSHTRPGLYLDQDDFNIVRSYFPDPWQVFLVVRPAADGPPTGGFFFWEDGDINRKAPYRQFPLDRQRLLKGSFPLTGAPLPVASPRTSSPARPPAVRLQRRLPQIPWLAVPVLAGVFLIAGFFVSRDRNREQPVQSAPPPAAQTAAERQSAGLHLDVANTGNGIEVRWDPNAPVVRNADLGLLQIRDGDKRFSRALEPAELAAGRTNYSPVSAKVEFELRVYTLADKNNKSIEQVQPAATLPQAQMASNAPQPDETNQALAPSPHPKTGTADRVFVRTSRKRAPERKLYTGPISTPSAPATHRHSAEREVEPPPAITANHFHQPGLTTLLPPSLSAPPAYTTVSYEQPRQGPLRRAFRKLSTLGDSDGDSFVPPSPVRQVTPADPDPGLTGTVDVKVYIDEFGKVSRAQLLTKKNELAAPSLKAAQEWHFTPARKRDKAVPSEMVLHFRFGPGEL